MHVILTAESKLLVGKQAYMEGPSPSTKYSAVFEDDGATGYFYGLDHERADNPILDAMQIYNVENVADSEIPSDFKIVWSEDGFKTALLINDFPHAVFDFESQRGYCRSGFPESNPNWTQHSHEWSDDALELFR